MMEFSLFPLLLFLNFNKIVNTAPLVDGNDGNRALLPSSNKDMIVGIPIWMTLPLSQFFLAYAVVALKLGVISRAFDLARDYSDRQAKEKKMAKEILEQIEKEEREEAKRLRDLRGKFSGPLVPPNWSPESWFKWYSQALNENNQQQPYGYLPDGVDHLMQTQEDEDEGKKKGKRNRPRTRIPQRKIGSQSVPEVATEEVPKRGLVCRWFGICKKLTLNEKIRLRLIEGMKSKHPRTAMIQRRVSLDSLPEFASGLLCRPLGMCRTNTNVNNQLRTDHLKKSKRPKTRKIQKRVGLHSVPNVPKGLVCRWFGICKKKALYLTKKDLTKRKTA